MFCFNINVIRYFFALFKLYQKDEGEPLKVRMLNYYSNKPLHIFLFTCNRIVFKSKVYIRYDMSHFSLREVIVLPNIITSQLLHDGSPLIFGKKKSVYTFHTTLPICVEIGRLFINSQTHKLTVLLT